MNQLALGVTIALRDAFSAKARSVGRGFSNLDDIAYRSARGIARSADMIEADIFRITQTFAAGFAALGAITYPIAKAAQFGEALAEVASIADYATTNMAALRKEVLRQAYEYPTSPLQQVEALYQTISSGFINTSEAIRVLESATRLGVTTLTETPQALRALTGVLNAYSKNFKDAGTTVVDQLDLVEAKMFETIRYGRIRMDELGKYVGYGASASAIAGINLDDMLASVAAMTLGSLSPEQAFQYYRQLVIGTVKPTAQAAKVAEKYGIGLGESAIADFGGDWSLWLRNAYNVIAVQNNNLEDFARLLSGRQAFAGAATMMNMWEKFTDAREGIASPYVIDPYGAMITSQERAMRMRKAQLGYQVDQFFDTWNGIFIALGHAGEQWLTPMFRGVNEVLGMTQQLVDRLPLLQEVFFGLGMLFSSSVFAFGFLQVRELMKSDNWRKVMAAYKTQKFPLFGLQLTAQQAIRTFGVLFMTIAGGAALIKKAYDANYGGFANTMDKWRTVLSATFGAQRDGEWFVLDQQIYENLGNLQPLYERLIQMRFRVEEFFGAFTAGFKQWMWDLGWTLKTAAENVASFVGRFSTPAAEKIRAFVQSFNLPDSAVETWRKVGHVLGQMTARLLVLGGLFKVFSFGRSVLSPLVSIFGAGGAAAGGLVAQLTQARRVGTRGSKGTDMGIANADILVRNARIVILSAAPGTSGRGGGGGRDMGTRWGGPLGPKGLPGGGGSSVMVFGGGAGIWNGAKRLGGKVAGAAVRTPGLGWIAAVLAGLGMIAFKWDDITSFMKAKMPTWWGLFSSLGSVIRGVGVEIGTVLSLTGARFAQWFTQIRDGYMRIIRWGWNFSTSLLQGMGEIGKGIANVMSWAARAARGSWTSTLGFIAAGWASFKAQNPLLAELVVGAKGAAGGLWNMVRPLSPSEILGGGKGKGQAMSAKLERGDYATILMGLSRASDPYTSDKAAYQKVNAARRYSDGFDSFSQTRMSAADVAAIRAAGLQLPFDPTAMPDFRKLAPNQISDLETSLGNFLSDNAAKTLLRDGALKDRGWWGLFQGAEAGLAEMLRLEGATVGAGAGLDPDRFADDMWTTGAAEQAISNGVKDGMVEAARIVSPYATEEYQHLWDQSVGQSYGKLYRDMSKQTLASTAVGMAAVQERGARGREENVRELARQTQAALDETRRVAQAVRDAGGDLVVDGQKLGRWVMNKLSTSKSDNKPRGVERGDALGAF